MRILLVEDHASLRELTASHLTARGFVVDTARDLGEAQAALDVVAYDALVIDLGLPDGDGIALLSRRGRRAGQSAAPTPPALILTARDGVEDRIAGLNAGADDYLVKPFKMEELEARLRAVLRRPGARTGMEQCLGDLSFDTVGREARVRGRPLPLRRREMLLLESLLSQPGRIVVRDVLEERLYGADDAVTPNALEAVVSRLRRALAEAAVDVRIETHRGIGYRLLAPPPT